MLVVFLPIFVVDTKITFVYNFVATPYHNSQLVISHAKLQINVSIFVSGWKWQSGTKDGPLLCPGPVSSSRVSVKENVLNCHKSTKMIIKWSTACLYLNVKKCQEGHYWQVQNKYSVLDVCCNCVQANQKTNNICWQFLLKKLTRKYFKL